MKVLQNICIYMSSGTDFPLKSTHQHIQGLLSLWNVNLFSVVCSRHHSDWNGYYTLPLKVIILLFFSDLCNAAVETETPPQNFLGFLWPGKKNKQTSKQQQNTTLFQHEETWKFTPPAFCVQSIASGKTEGRRPVLRCPRMWRHAVNCEVTRMRMM